MSLSVPTVLQLQDIYAEIEQDAGIQALKRQIADGETVKKGLTIVDGGVWYKKRLLIPHTSRFIPLLLKEFHDGLQGGHSCIFKTLKRIQILFIGRTCAIQFRLMWLSVSFAKLTRRLHCLLLDSSNPYPFQKLFGRISSWISSRAFSPPMASMSFWSL